MEGGGRWLGCWAGMGQFLSVEVDGPDGWTYCSIQRREIHEQEIPISGVVYLLNSLKLSLYYLAVERGKVCGVVARKGVF